MSDLGSYLLAQARYRPVATARFVASEAWRRGRLRLKGSFAGSVPQFDASHVQRRLALFLPSGIERCREWTSSGVAEEVCSRAQALLRHEFSFFGKSVQLGAVIDWHRDWESGYRWPMTQNGSQRLVDAAPGADVKRPWELARFHHLLTLGRAFALTSDEQYAREFRGQVRDFLRANPSPSGIHWAMPMEVAIRAANWATAGAFFVPSAALDGAFWQEFFRALFLHGRFIAAHHEWNAVARGNHYLSCVVGAAFLGTLFSGQPEGRGWLSFARRELQKEMFAQVGEDGVAHEGSSGYHAFVTELFLSAALLLSRREGRDLSAHSGRAAIEEALGVDFAGRLEKMFEFLAALTAGREQPPIWGDGDDGSLLPFCDADACAAHHLLAVARVVFQREDWARGCPDCLEPPWRLGIPPARQQPQQPQLCATTAKCSAFAQGGFYFFSSERLRGSVRCGPLGVNGWANHAHCDQLSIEFCWDGRPVIVDPGSFAYSGDVAARNLFRSSRYHNSVVVNGEEQNRFWPGLLFRMVDDARGRTVKWTCTDHRVEFAGEHSGYARLPECAHVQRHITLDRKSQLLQIRDTVDGRGAARLEWNWRLAPGLEALPMPFDSASAQAGDGPAMCGAWRIGPVILRMFAPAELKELDFEIAPSWVAPRFGCKVPAQILQVRANGPLPGRAVFEFAEH